MLKKGEQIYCDKCKKLVIGKETEPWDDSKVKVYVEEAIRSDDEIDRVYCKDCFKEIKRLRSLV